MLQHSEDGRLLVAALAVMALTGCVLIASETCPLDCSRRSAWTWVYPVPRRVNSSARMPWEQCLRRSRSPLPRVGCPANHSSSAP